MAAEGARGDGCKVIQFAARSQVLIALPRCPEKLLSRVGQCQLPAATQEQRNTQVCLQRVDPARDLSALEPGARLANDLALDAKGNAYVTDSFAPIIYRIDTRGHASIFARDDRFIAGKGFNLNGIVVHPDGYLLVDLTNSGQLFKIDIHDPTSCRRR